jgi:hypothetical protein
MSVINILSFSFIFLILILELYTNFYKPVLVKKAQKVVPKVGREYYLTLPADLDLAEKLLKEKFVFSYSPQGIFLSLNSTQNVEKLLNFYKKYRENLEKQNIAKKVVVNFIKENLAVLKKEYKETLTDYQKLYNIFISRGIKVNFEILKPQILEIQKETYEGYKKYWDQKLEQIEKNYTIEVTKPLLNPVNLLKKARTIYNEELKFNLFQLYLNAKILEANIAADLYKLNEFSEDKKEGK